MNNRKYILGLLALFLTSNLTQIQAIPVLDTVSNVVWYKEGVFSFNIKPFASFVAENPMLSVTGATLGALVGMLYWRKWSNAQVEAKNTLIQNLGDMLVQRSPYRVEVGAGLNRLAYECYAIPFVSRAISTRSPYYLKLNQYIQQFIVAYTNELQRAAVGKNARDIFNEIRQLLLGKFIV